MSAPVGVLEVLDEILSYASRGVDRDDPIRELIEAGHEARNTVAELIEAARRANGDHSAPHDCYATGPLTGDPIRDLVSCPGCELSAALARVQGSAP